jgi:predicted ATPase/DNA-binding SARP family transcriptional activator
MTTQAAASSAPLRLFLFGRLRIERNGEPRQLPTRQVRSLLAYLALHPGPHPREKLAALFWGDVPDANARASLRNALAVLRRQLDRQLLLADRETVQLRPGFPLWVDAIAFQAQASALLRAPAVDPDTVNLDLVGEELLADSYEEWVLAERERLRQLYLETLLACTQQLRAQGEYAQALNLAERALAVDSAEELAHQHIIFCHVASGNRSAALAQYEACRRALHDELGVEPSPATKKLYHWIRQAPAERMAVEAALTNLPVPLTSFVGRQREMGAVKKRLAAARLLTLTGAGGSGKTRLAIQVAIDVLDDYEDGVWWVELGPLADPALVPPAVAKVLSVPEVSNQTVSETLAIFLRARELLMILDNCEHLIAACAEMAGRLLSSCPQLAILATSRETLAIRGEQVWPVPTLSVPDRQPVAPADLQQQEAVRLFMERARSVRPDFRLTDQNAVAVADICRRLDGLPLAIELAAARANVLPVAEIAGRLDDRFQLLTAGSRTALPRHQTLRAALDWSYQLLPGAEQTLLRRLSVFAGGWTVEAAEAICAGESIAARDVFPLLSRLVEKSLVEARPRGEQGRFRLLQTPQQYSRERLLEAGESSRVQERHLYHFLGLVEAAQPHLGYFLSATDMDLWLARLEAEYDNLRAAVRWSLEKGNRSPAATEAGLRLASNLHWLWFARGHFTEGRAWLERLLATSSEVQPAARAQALLTAGYSACWQGDFAAGARPLQEALSIFHRLEDGSGITFSLHGLGFVALGQGWAGRSRAHFEEALHSAQELGDPWLTAFTLHFLAIVLSYQGDLEQATYYFHEGTALLEPLGGHRQGLGFSLFHLARIARLQADYAAAESRLAEGLHRFQQIGDRRGAGYCLAGFAVLAATHGHHERAACLSGAVASLQALIGPFLEVPLQAEYDQALGAVRAALDEAAFARASAGGQAMSLEEAIAYALESGGG